MRVLVVEDEADLGAVFADFLTELGHQPVVVQTAEAALGRLETERPDAILLDIQLPGMSGIEFLRLRPVRQSGLPVVAVSGVITESQARECLRLGAVDFVGKPVELDQLHAVLAFLEPHTPGGGSAGTAPRRVPRAVLEMPVTLHEYGGATRTATCVDVSPSGMRLRLPPPTPAIGTAVRCAFAPPDDRPPIEVMAFVRAGGGDSVAIAFANLSDADATRLARLLRRADD